jgi:hypothetical protein
VYALLVSSAKVNVGYNREEKEAARKSSKIFPYKFYKTATGPNQEICIYNVINLWYQLNAHYFSHMNVNIYSSDMFQCQCTILSEQMMPILKSSACY